MQSKYLGSAPTGVAYATSGGVSTNSTTSPIDKIDKTAPALEEAGDYEVTFYIEGKTDTPGTSTCKLEVLLDGAAKAETNIETDKYQHFSGAAIFPFNKNDTPRIQIQFTRIGAASVVSVRRAYVALKPMAKVTP